MGRAQANEIEAEPLAQIVRLPVLDGDGVLHNVRADGTEWIRTDQVLFVYRPFRDCLIVLPDRTIKAKDSFEDVADKFGFRRFAGAVYRPEPRRDARFGGTVGKRPGAREDCQVAFNAQAAESFFRSTDGGLTLRIVYPGGWQVGVPMSAEDFAELLA